MVMEQPVAKVKLLWQKSSSDFPETSMLLSMKVVPLSTLHQSWPAMSSQT